MNWFGAALQVARVTPESVWRPAMDLAAPAVAAINLEPIRRWQTNAEIVTGRPPTRRETAQAVRSWGRNLMESVQLQRWSEERVRASVTIDPDDHARLLAAHRARRDGRGGLVLALPHLGSWDLAGAWACLNGLPVATVAEAITDFELFAGVRRALGMVVHRHDDPMVAAKLDADLASGRVVCLIGDRIFGRGGAFVDWPTPGGAIRMRVPLGPAHLAVSRGAELVGVATHYHREGIHIELSPRLRAQASEPSLARRELTEQLVAFFAEQVGTHPTDWHMLQPFFPEVAA